MSGFLILTDKHGDAIAFNPAQVIAVQVATKGSGAIISTVRCDADSEWSWNVKETFAEVMASITGEPA